MQKTTVSHDKKKMHKMFRKSVLPALIVEGCCIQLKNERASW